LLHPCSFIYDSATDLTQQSIDRRDNIIVVDPKSTYLFSRSVRARGSPSSWLVLFSVAQTSSGTWTRK